MGQVAKKAGGGACKVIATTVSNDDVACSREGGGGWWYLRVSQGSNTHEFMSTSPLVKYIIIIMSMGSPPFS